MIDKLINLVKENGRDEIAANPAIPDERNEEAMMEVSDEINKGLEHEAREGNVGNLVSMFKGNTAGGLTSNPVVKSIISNIAEKLGSRFNLSQEQSTSIAAGIVPKVLNQFINKTNDPNDKDFDLHDVLKKFTGKSDIGDLVGQFTGGKPDIGETIGGFFKEKK